jgi:hypothetical protein
MVFVQDATVRTYQKERATRIQGDLLPKGSPVIDGYELSGGCLPAQDVSGDFFDWVLREDGHLDLTIADVMGKGMAAALVMAAIRTGLRAVAPECGPAERVRIASESLALRADDEGLFVTLFRADWTSEAGCFATWMPATATGRSAERAASWCTCRAPRSRFWPSPTRSSRRAWSSWSPAIP